MKILIIGGTRFVGRHLAEAALASGHTVTLFNRGKSNPGLFPGVEEIVGDRDGGLGVLEDGQWDAVIDTCGYYPRVVRESSEFLSDLVDRYVFISTISVYKDVKADRIDEDAELCEIDDPTVEELTGETYGPLKVLCEKAVEDVYGDRGLIVRPGLIVGPHDTSDRFTYWMYRFAQGGRALVPDLAEQPTQFIDARDLAEWTLRLIEKNVSGSFNATGPLEKIYLNDFLSRCHKVCESQSELVWVSDEFLRNEKVGAFTELPLWLSSEEKPYQLDCVDCSKAVSAGLVYRPTDQTILDTLAWLRTRPDEYEMVNGLSEAREIELLEKWD